MVDMNDNKLSWGAFTKQEADDVAYLLRTEIVEIKKNLIERNATKHLIERFCSIVYVTKLDCFDEN